MISIIQSHIIITSLNKSDNTFEQHNKKNQLMRIKNSDRKNKLKKKNTPRSKSDILKEL